MPFAATWMGLEVSQKEKDKYHMIPLKCGIYNMTQMNLQNRYRLTEVRLVFAKADGGGAG